MMLDDRALPAEPSQIIAELRRERDEALAREAAIAEVLQVINSSPGDLTPVFDAMLEKATRLCEAAFGILLTYDGNQFRHAALRGIPPAYAEFMREHPPIYAPASAPGRLAAGERLVQVIDMMDTDLYRSGEANRRAIVDLAGARTIIAVALRKDSVLLGTIVVFRQEVRPFTEKQLALLKNFAAQAVIAMENARLLTETREALEQQTATAQVLQVINSSPSDLRPVFDAILDKAHALCGAACGGLMIYDGEAFHVVAAHGEPQFVEYWQQGSIRPPEGTPLWRVMHGEPIAHIVDAIADDSYHHAPAYSRLIDLGGARTFVIVPLRKDEAFLGVITAFRQELRPFTDKQIALLQNFAAQAVIAMENARLLTETREALEQQTATAEVLSIISSSPGQLEPVFDAILASAVRVCAGKFGMLALTEDTGFRGVAAHGVGSEFPATLSRIHDPPPGTGLNRLRETSQTVQIADCATDPAYDPVRALNPAFATVRTALHVPMLKEGRLLGAIVIYRDQVLPFDDKEIELVENFAKQAVIAIENTRLITEIREALEQQTATAEVLQVINSSPGDLAPVFDAMLEKAMRLCGAQFGGLGTWQEERFGFVAVRGPQSLMEYIANNEVSLGSRDGFSRVASGLGYVQFTDISTSELYQSGEPYTRALVDLCGGRTTLSVPLAKDGSVPGVLAFFRQEVKPFTDKEIALVNNFAAQAVIAMENARLLTETREALEQQTATAEVLQVINSSPGDLGPVFQAMLQKAHTLCEASFGALMIYDGERFHAVAHQGTPAPFREFLASGIRPGPGDPFGRMVEGAALSHTHDLSEVAARYPSDPLPRAAVDLGGIRTLLVVPLRKDGALLGVITAYRQEVRSFTDKQIALLQNFAAQAVIAMENARLLEEIRQRQAELRVTFDNMVDGVVMFDPSLHLAAWNRNFQELLQLPDDFLAGRPDFDIYIRYLTERGEFGETEPETEIARLHSRLRDHYSFERTRPDGTVIEVRHNPMPDGGVVLIISDITERKRSETEIRAARDAAEAAYRDLKAAQASLIQAEKMASLGQLTAGIAHEIKNPLNFVNNFASLSNELLKELKDEAEPALATLDDDKRAEIDETLLMLSGNLEKIAEHGKRADNIVKSMLEHSRGASGERREVDLNGLIEEALNLAYHGARAQDQSFNITLERKYAASLKPIELAPQEMTRVFLNLFGNGFYAATKRARANADGPFRPVLAVATREAGDAVEIRVRDNGTGIAPEIRDRLFQPFVTTKPTGEGTGLGLSIAYDIVTQQHGGVIEVDSRVGEFTEFTIRLPRLHQSRQDDER